jgi:hypothetical protein
MSKYKCSDCQDTGWITTRTWPKMTYVATPGPAPEDARGVMTLRCDCGTPIDLMANVRAGYDLQDIDEAIQDAICDDEGSLHPRSLLYHLNKRGLTIAPAARHDYPRPVERLAKHAHAWEVVHGVITCITCGEQRE